MFFTIQTKHTILQLVKQQITFIQKYKIGLNTKDSDLEHTKRIRIILGVHLKFASISWYKNHLEKKYNIEKGLIKLRKEKVYKRNYDSKCLVVYAIESAADSIDKKLKDIKDRQENTIKYISFKHTNSKNRMG